MFSQPMRGFSNGQEPWFRIGTFDVGSAGVASLIILVGSVVTAISGVNSGLTRTLVFNASKVADGQIWRLLTWVFPTEPSLGMLLSTVFIYLLGSQIEGALGRIKMAKYLAYLILICSVLAQILYAIGLPTSYALTSALLSAGVFYTFLTYRPGVRFFFGIPGWILGAVFFSLEALQLLEFRSFGDLAFLFLRVGGFFLLAKVFGLANDVDWIPDLRTAVPASKTPSHASGGSRRRGRKRSSSAKAAASARPMVVVDSSFEEMGIDEILDQISAFGVESLNDAQRKKLDAYSKGRKKGS